MSALQLFFVPEETSQGFPRYLSRLQMLVSTQDFYLVLNFLLSQALQRAMGFPFPLYFKTFVSSESLDRCVMMFPLKNVWMARIQDCCHSIGKVPQFFF